MKPLLVFVVGLLVFSGGGMQGRLGSVLAAFIDPGALVEVSPQQDAPLPPGVKKLDPGSHQFQPPTAPKFVKPGPGNSCPVGYLYVSETNQCLRIDGLGQN